MGTPPALTSHTVAAAQAKLAQGREIGHLVEPRRQRRPAPRFTWLAGVDKLLDEGDGPVFHEPRGQVSRRKGHFVTAQVVF